MAYTTIKKPSDYFNTKLYTGNGGTNVITGVGFQPDLAWFKSRNVADSHNLLDVVRGLDSNLISNTSGAQVAIATQTFNSDGYVLTNDGGAPSLNSYGDPIVSWNWKANGAGSANTDGSISSTVSANTTSGFSIVSYTGTGSAENVGHGLSSAPKIYIMKNLTDANDWKFYTTAIDGTLDVLNLNNTDAKADSGGSLPTNSIFSIGTNANQGESGKNYIAYCFADVQGFSKFGSYLGNGNADGTFIYTGFKPAWFMVKQTNAAGNSWHILDNKRDSFNVMEKNLRANLSNAEFDTGVDFDFLSNGVKMRNTDGASNNFGGSTYIYMAFAEQPLVGDNPATAR